MLWNKIAGCLQNPNSKSQRAICSGFAGYSEITILLLWQKKKPQGLALYSCVIGTSSVPVEKWAS